MNIGKLAVISDPHFHPFKQHATLTADGLNSRLAATRDAFAEAVRIAKAQNCRTLLIPGDITHVRGMVKPSVLNTVGTCLSYAMNAGLDVVMIPGNHDMEDYKGGPTSIDTFKGMGDAVIGTVYLLRDAGYVNLNGVAIGGIPYMHDLEEFREAYKAMQDSGKCDVVMIHQGVDTFKPSATMPDFGLDADWLDDHMHSKCKAVLAGHYHGGKRQGKVLSPGSLTQQTFADEGQKHGVWIIDINAETPTFTFHDIDSPKFVTISAAKQCTEEALQGNYVRVQAKTVAKGNDLRARCEKAGAASIVVQLEKEFKTAHEEQITLTTPDDMIDQYVNKVRPELLPMLAQIKAAFKEVCLGGSEVATD